jgi:predicted small lipoprotein YifL
MLRQFPRTARRAAAIATIAAAVLLAGCGIKGPLKPPAGAAPPPPPPPAGVDLPSAVERRE